MAAPTATGAGGLHAIIDGLIQNWLLDSEAFDLVAVGQDVVDIYLAGLGLKPAHGPAALLMKVPGLTPAATVPGATLGPAQAARGPA